LSKGDVNACAKWEGASIEAAGHHEPNLATPHYYHAKISAFHIKCLKSHCPSQF